MKQVSQFFQMMIHFLDKIKKSENKKIYHIKLTEKISKEILKKFKITSKLGSIKYLLLRKK